jgi:hypothetical protein
MVESAAGDKALPIVPPRRNWGRFTWVPLQIEKKTGAKLPVVASYRGLIHAMSYDRNFRELKGPTERIIRTQADYESFVGKIPKRTISKTNPSPPSNDPLLKKPPVDFEKHMMLVAVRANSMYVTPKLESVAVEKGTMFVHVLDPDLGDTRFLNQMQGIGTYLALVVPKHAGPIKFLRKKGKPAPRLK